MEINYKDFLISDDKKRLQPDKITQMLSATYWACGRTKETVLISIENSLCFGIYLNEIQIGFARCVTDYATVYWLADVIIEDAYRGLGLGKALIKAIAGHELLKETKGILMTRDAHGLYKQYGFHPMESYFMFKEPER